MQSKTKCRNNCRNFLHHRHVLRGPKGKPWQSCLETPGLIKRTNAASCHTPRGRDSRTAGAGLRGLCRPQETVSLRPIIPRTQGFLCLRESHSFLRRLGCWFVPPDVLPHSRHPFSPPRHSTPSSGRPANYVLQTFLASGQHIFQISRFQTPSMNSSHPQRRAI